MLNLRPRALILQIGTNAALRGEEPKGLRAPLQKALVGCEARHVPVLVLGPQHAQDCPLRLQDGEGPA